MDTDIVQRDSRVELVLVGLLLVVVAQVARLLFPVMFEIGEDWNFLYAGLVALAVFCSPLVAIPLAAARSQRRARRRFGRCRGSARSRTTARPDPGDRSDDARRSGTRRGCPRHCLPGRCSDAGLGGVRRPPRSGARRRGPPVARTWDLPWRHDVVPLIAGLFLTVGLISSAALAGRHDRSRNGTVRPSALVVAGAIAALELLFLTNVGFVSSHADLRGRVGDGGCLRRTLGCRCGVRGGPTPVVADLAEHRAGRCRGHSRLDAPDGERADGAAAPGGAPIHRLAALRGRCRVTARGGAEPSSSHRRGNRWERAVPGDRPALAAPHRPAPALPS